jgi:hypothetical protein
VFFGGQLINNGKLVAVAPPGIAIWNSLPTSAAQVGDLFVGQNTLRDPDPPNTSYGYHMWAGDAAQAVVAPNGVVYIALSGANMVIGYNSLPTYTSQYPDFAIGSPDIDTYSYYAHGFMNNPTPATDGNFLLAISAVDRKLAIWNSIPAQSSTAPDTTYDLGARQLSAGALSGGTYVAVGENGVTPEVDIWTSLPPSGPQANLVFSGSIGSVNFSQSTTNAQIGGVALDGQYLYLSDMGAGKVYVWNRNNLPDPSDTSTPPLFSLDTTAQPPASPANLSSDGTYLAVIVGSTCRLYAVSSLSTSSTPLVVLPATGASYSFGAGSPNSVLIANNQLFLSDATAGRVLAWTSISRAIAGGDPDVVLGQSDLNQGLTEGIAQNRLFWPASLAFDGSRLWVGEFKFSGRILAFNTNASQPATVSVVSGSGQGTSSNTSFTNALVVQVKDASSNPVSGVTVTFSGAGLSFTNGGVALTDSNGRASVKATATSVGSLTASASASGVSAPATFSLMAGPVPRVVTSPITGIGTATATVNAVVNPNGAATTYWFEYGVRPASASFIRTSPQTLSAGASGVAVHASLTGLAPQTVYYFQIVAQNPFGTSSGRILEFRSRGRQKVQTSGTSTRGTDSVVSPVTSDSAVSPVTSHDASANSSLISVRNTSAATKTAISTQTATLEIAPGRTTPLVVSLVGAPGTPIAATCSGLPEGATCSYDDTSQTVTITPAANTAPRSYPIEVIFATEPGANP